MCYAHWVLDAPNSDVRIFVLYELTLDQIQYELYWNWLFETLVNDPITSQNDFAFKLYYARHKRDYKDITLSNDMAIGFFVEGRLEYVGNPMVKL